MRMFLPLSLCTLCLFLGCGLFDNDSPDFFKVKVVSAVEVALEINASEGSVISIERGGNEISSFRLNCADTVIYDSGLKPATSYIWKVRSSAGRGRSLELQATTLDTTSSNFTWQTFTFGEHSSSILYGVSVIDENNIWAVGEIHMNSPDVNSDSDTTYNIVHWNGTEWELINREYNCRLYYPNCGPVTSLYAMGTSVIAFGEDDVWITAGSLHHFDGMEWRQEAGILGVGNSNTIWGHDSEDLWFGSRNGFVANRRGESWQNIETNTELDFYDIHGNGQKGVVAVAAKQSQSSDKLILRINNDLTSEILSSSPIPSSISGIWFDEHGITYAVGNRISLKSKIDSNLPWKNLSKQSIDYPYLFAIDANGLNDFITVGGFGRILHFNGTQWVKFETNIVGNLYDVAIKGNTVVSVGFDGSKAFIAIGKRED